MTTLAYDMSKLRFFGNVALDTIIAVFGTAVLESSLPHRTPHSGDEIIWRIWMTSTVVATVLGVLATRYGARKTAVWAWIIPVGVFAVGALFYASRWSTGFATHFSGYDCAVGLQKSDCRDFFGITVPVIRGLSYSAAAQLTLRIWQSGKDEKRENRTV